ncbi:MAG TPA: hypothetical protein VJR24_17750 [Gemmatimonadaceae bacterium]|nr:hypothetical protein [Gemmatimonadaceae bacterium]
MSARGTSVSETPNVARIAPAMRWLSAISSLARTIVTSIVLSDWLM